MTTLAELVQGLPRELYDEIYNFVFMAPFGLVVNINSANKPPAQLQVDRSSREQFAKSYYGGDTIFYISKDYSREWSKALTSHHASLLNNVRIEGPDIGVTLPVRHRLTRLLRILHRYPYWHHPENRDHSVKFKITMRDANETRWMSIEETLIAYQSSGEGHTACCGQRRDCVV